MSRCQSRYVIKEVRRFGQLCVYDRWTDEYLLRDVEDIVLDRSTLAEFSVADRRYLAAVK